MPDINQTYEDKLSKHLLRTLQEVQALYEASVQTVALRAASITLKGTVFRLKDYPTLNALVDKVIKELHGELYTTVVNSMKTSWDLSNEKNNLFVDRRLAGKNPSKTAKSILYDPNKGALKAFIERKEKGLNLSDRVWNTLAPFKTELEQGLGLGISEGKSASKLASELKKNLNEPDKLFRRVRGEDGKLKLSRAARDYHPGQGVYRSSYKNSLRLTRTENQMAYQNADHARWSRLPFVVGIEVRLSNNHRIFDQCDHLKGKYPKTFHFSAWHPQCRCNAVPIMASDDQYNEIEDALLEGRKVPELKGVEGMPASATKWIKDNAERIKGWKSTPYFVRNNPDFVKDLLKKKR